MLPSVVRTLLVRLRAWFDARFFVAGDRGQATAEYALVLLGAALVALLLVAWATAGGGAGKIGALFDKVLDTITSKVT
jgi:Flp pilus assembly pilin Flp